MMQLKMDSNESSDLLIILSILPSLLTGSPMPTKRRISKRGCPVQQRQAQKLHRQAGVTEGPCGLEELRQF